LICLFLWDFTDKSNLVLTLPGVSRSANTGFYFFSSAARAFMTALTIFCSSIKKARTILSNQMNQPKQNVSQLGKQQQ
jgi:hypothetical protein